MVAPNWDHPYTYEMDFLRGKIRKRYVPMYDRSISEETAKWIDEYELWKQGKHPDQLNGSAKDCKDFSDWNGGPPNPSDYRPDWQPEDMTWFQVYETVSEGTPVTPPFETREELVEYLVSNGDFADQQRRKEGCTDIPCEPWSRKRAEGFVFGRSWLPTGSSDDQVKSGVKAMD